jgi:hypothetical protein
MYFFLSVCFVRLSSLGHCFHVWMTDPHQSEKPDPVSVSESTDGSGSTLTQNLEVVEAQNGAMEDRARSQ